MSISSFHYAETKGKGVRGLPDLDRFAYGFQDPQQLEPEAIERCLYYRCQNPIYSGEKNWDLDGEWFCSAACLAKYIGAKKRFVDRAW